MDANSHYEGTSLPEPLVEAEHSSIYPGGEQEEPEDIYRGKPSSTSSPRAPPPRAASVSSSSSSGWSGLGLRRSALGAVLELAINRWARASSGASNSDSSSTSSVHTQRPQQRRRRSSNATTRNAHSESIIRARRKARDENRVLQQEFGLFLPDALIPLDRAGQGAPVPLQYLRHRTVRSTSLSPVLAQLDSAIKRSAKLRRPKQRKNGLQSWFNDYMQPPTSPSAPDIMVSYKDRGKAREDMQVPGTPETPARASLEQPQTPQPWWLDVSSPTWSDMREIGKVLHLHPLTLEDILHQDPREKLELFPRLGYYFIVFRALESERMRAQMRTDAIAYNDAASFSDETILGINVYIVVFRDGICSFHFEDIADHIDRVRNKILRLEETVNMTSDWIAHGLLDSIVDDFFPMLNSIEQETKDLGNLLLAAADQPPEKHILQRQEVSPIITASLQDKTPKLIVIEDKEKTVIDTPGSVCAPVLVKRSGLGGVLSWSTGYIRRMRAVLLALDIRRWIHFRKDLPTPSPLIRMTSTRRLVTSLARLLGRKSEVISQTRKRLTSGADMGPKIGPLEQVLATEVSIHFGDIQDHIITLQQSLAHCERMLSHLHPAYLSHLRLSVSQTKSDMDKAILILSVISVTLVSMQLITGVFSVNVGKVPQNRRPSRNGPVLPPSPFNVFAAVLVGLVLVGVGIVYLARYWWLRAKQKYARRQKI